MSRWFESTHHHFSLKPYVLPHAYLKARSLGVFALGTRLAGVTHCLILLLLTTALNIYKRYFKYKDSMGGNHSITYTLAPVS